MAWRIHDHVTKGEIDNRRHGRVQGRLWLAGRDEPLMLDLTGNCLRDLAGCVMEFENPSPARSDFLPLNGAQHGTVGDMTASRKVRVLDVPIEEALRLGKEGYFVPEHQANSLYLEWYDKRHGRVVIESANYKITLSAREWTLSRDEEELQAAANMQAFRDFLQQASGLVSAEQDRSCDGKPMNEFEYEQFLRECDARSEKYGELLEKYGEQPGGEAIIDREMGWDSLEAEPGSDGYEALPEFAETEEPDPLEPDPATRGIDWVRDKSGHIRHPLVERVSMQRVELFRYCKKHGYLHENGDADAQEMLFQYQTTGAKLAGALNALAYLRQLPLEPGGIVARLKRALDYLHLSINAAEKVAKKNLLPTERLATFRKEQFAVREEILNLMKRFRKTS